MKIIAKNQLEQFQDIPLLISQIEEGFVKYSQKRALMPPVGHMPFADPPGDLHIKSAAIPGGNYFVVKIAGHFPENVANGMPAINGLMLVFCQRTGKPEALLFDEGYLTQLRTGIAGLICAKYLAPKQFDAIGIIGAGAQARIQLQLLAHQTPCRKVWIWSPRHEELIRYQNDPALKDFEIQIAASAAEVVEKCRLIVTTTPSRKPLLFSQDIRPGTHITAVGADSPGKQELDAKIFSRADIVVVDSREQCCEHGDTVHAVTGGYIDRAELMELGEVIAGTASGRTSDQQITIADLTGLGVQDLQIASAVYQQFLALQL
ncbi:MAG: deaminase [Parachlamydia sp.]|nr:deaminase [Parachlamydia sp.]